MDEMKLKLSTKLMRGIVAKLAMKVISKKIGIKTDIKLHEIAIEKVGDKIQLHLNVDATMNERDLLKITRLVEDEELD